MVFRRSKGSTFRKPFVPSAITTSTPGISAIVLMKLSDIFGPTTTTLLPMTLQDVLGAQRRARGCALRMLIAVAAPAPLGFKVRANLSASLSFFERDNFREFIGRILEVARAADR